MLSTPKDRIIWDVGHQAARHHEQAREVPSLPAGNSASRSAKKAPATIST
jgi:hypothetical protein